MQSILYCYSCVALCAAAKNSHTNMQRDRKKQNDQQAGRQWPDRLVSRYSYYCLIRYSVKLQLGPIYNVFLIR